jgi:predicted transposase YdaD
VDATPQDAKQNTMEEKALMMARKMLARGMSLSEVAEIAELPVEDLQELVPH